MKQTSYSFDLNGKNVVLETGTLAQQATSSVLARLGETTVLATVVMSKRDTLLDYFPLSVEYVERLYAGGRIKGSRWVKREGRPTDEAILTGRLIDRSIRPLFPKELKKDIQVVVTVLSVDGENDPDVLSIIATSAALAVSKIPWRGPVGAVRIGAVKEVGNGGVELLVNPNSAEHDLLDLDIVLTSGPEGKVLMIEAGAKQIPEDIASKAVKLARECNTKIVEGINGLVKEVGEEKITVQKDTAIEEIKALVEKSYKDKIIALLEGDLPEDVSGEVGKIADSIVELEGEGADKGKILQAVDYIFKKTVRERIIKEGKRIDGRKIDEIRPLSARAKIIPRVHGSGLFQRGQTQVLSIATLGSAAFGQLIESPEGEETKRYMHHYSFPPYSVGETGRIGSPSRREIGHGALAERALEAVIPSEEKFPYTIRVVSEVMSSNGSTSMASVCGSTLALMDAGVPITTPVAGIAMGLITDEKSHVVLTDIIGLEDFSGDMDFKVAGTKDGITAIQLDVKIDGLTEEMIAEVFTKAKDARLKILDVLIGAIPEARKEVSEYAPKIKMMQIDPEKIGAVIGSGGKVIKNIIATSGAQVDIEDDGSVSISAVDEEAVQKAMEMVEALTHEVKPGEIFEGTVKRMLSFGAFVEILPGKEGMVHVSEMSQDYVKDPGDVVEIGQAVKVRVKEIDDQGRINLSMKFGNEGEEVKEVREENRDRRGGDYRSDRGGDRRGGFRSDRGGDRRGGFRSDRGASRTRDEGQGGGRSFPSDWSQDVGKPTSRGGRFGSDRPRRPRR
jgi:polyribonucleotide nucleotidyltransferase